MLFPVSLKSRKTTRAMLLASVAIAAMAVAPPSRAAEFAAAIPLSSLNGTTGFALQGASGFDNSGHSVAGAGDVNGDGFGDFVIGAPLANSAYYDTGVTYIVLGKVTGGFPPISSLAGAGGLLVGHRFDDQSGWSTAGAGDVNGDGFDDVVVGAPRADVGTHSHAGKAYVVFGADGAFPPSVLLSTLNGRSGFRLEGLREDDYSGSSVAGAGDFNGDGFDDVIVGRPDENRSSVGEGSSELVFGKRTAFPARIAPLDGRNGFRLIGAAAGDHAGSAVAGAGDVNGDGFGDVIIGASKAEPNGIYSGSIYVVFGKEPDDPSGFVVNQFLADLGGSDGFRLDGASGELAGRSVAGAGDVNGDGFDDLIVGAPGASFGGAYVIFGKAKGFAATMNLSSLTGANGFRIDGAVVAFIAGESVAGAGDVNGDGFDDVIVGAHGTGSYAGASFVVFGKASGFAASIALSALTGVDGFKLTGETAADRSGQSVAGGGDINGDGFADVIVGAPNAVNGGGRTYTVFGRAPDSGRKRVGSAAGQYMSGGAFNDSLRALKGDDTLEGRGNGDRLDGGDGNDTATYVHAPAAVTAKLGSLLIGTGDAAGDTYFSIENLTGSRFADTLGGDNLRNRITGGPGADTVTGGGGRDIFVYTRISDSPSGTGRDRITDFNAGRRGTFVDRIDLSGVDAVKGAGNQAFDFIGTDAFFNQPGKLRAFQSGTSVIVEGNVNADSTPEFQIELQNFNNLAGLDKFDFRP